MASPSDVLRSRKTMLDYDMLQQQFDLMKQKATRDATGQDPAVIKIANKMAAARQVMGSATPGSPEYAAAQNMLDDLMVAGKMMDKGVLAPMGADWRGLGGAMGAPEQQGYQAPQFTGPNNPPSLPAAFDGLDDDPMEASRQAIMQQQGVTGVNPYQRPDLAGTSVIPGYAQSTGSIAATKKGMETQAQKDVELNMDPQIAREKARMGEIGKSTGEKEVALGEATARVPQLQNLVTRLSHLGSASTYTLTGRARDTFIREMGFDVPDAAVARADYISMVDNEILPLLRQTFGAQFTENEGKSLRATLGDPNASPREKDARLRSFIRTKMEDVNTQARALQQAEPFGQEEIDAFVANIGKKPDQGSSGRDQLQQQFQQKKAQKYQNMSDDQLLELLK